MLSTVQSYNQDVLEGCHEAVRALRALLAEEKDPLQRYRFATALLRARPAKEPKTEQPKAPLPPKAPPQAEAIADDDLSREDELGYEDDIGSENEAYRKIDELARRITAGPDPVSALHELCAIMKTGCIVNAAAAGPVESS